MSKKSVETSKKYLRIIGLIEMILSGISAVASFILLSPSIKIADLGIENVDKLYEAGMTDDSIRAVAVATGVIAGLIGVLIGWIIRRAGVNTKKTTAALVFIVLGGISAATALFTGKISNFGTSLSSIINLAVYIFAFIAVMNIRNAED